MKQVTIPAQWLQELIALCGPEDHELRERVMKSAASTPVDALATGGQAQAAMNQASEAMKLALSSHGLTLTSYPPQDAWATRGVSGKLSAAIAAIAAAKGK